MTLTLPISSGFKIWVAKDYFKDWNVYRVSESTTHAVKFYYSNADDYDAVTINEAIEFGSPHGLSVGDLFMIRGFDKTSSLSNFMTVDKFYQVSNVLTPTHVEVYGSVVITNDIVSQTISDGSLTGSGAVFILQSMRVSNLSDIVPFTPNHNWKMNDKVWADTDSINGEWAVYSKTEPWKYDKTLGALQLHTVDDIIPNLKLGHSVAATYDGLLVAVGSPTYENGVVRFFVKTTLNNYVASSSVDVGSSSTREFGYSLDISGRTLVSGAPGSDSDTGQVLVYNISSTGEPILTQILSLDLRSEEGTSLDLLDTGDRFGHSVSLSKDGDWLFVGAPVANKVFAFTKVNATNETTVVSVNTTNRYYSLPFRPSSTLGIIVKNGNTTLIPNRDYRTFTEDEPDLIANQFGNRIVFNSLPLEDYQCSVSQSPYYDYVATLESPSSEVDDKFGYSVDTSSNGEFTVVGAPHKIRDGIVDIGEAYMFTRYVEKFISNGNQLTFTVSKTITNTRLASVVVNGNKLLPSQVSIYADRVEFVEAPEINSTIIVNVNQFELIQTVSPENLVYSSKFGWAVTITDSGSDAFVSAPWYNIESYHGGVVYRFSNETKSFNTITGHDAMSSFTSDGIRINNQFVPISGVTPDDVVADINAAGIVGVKAFNDDGYLRVDYTAVSAFDSLSILNSGPMGLTTLGLRDTFFMAQEIHHPFANQYEMFGSTLVAGENGTLFIGSAGADTSEDLILDSGTTEFDSGITRIRNITVNTGSAYIFEELQNNHRHLLDPSKYGFIQQLKTDNTSPNDNFGAAIAISKNKIFVSATLDEYGEVENVGRVYAFTNNNLDKGWVKTRYQTPLTDPYQVSKMFMYDKKSQSILTGIDYYDPRKGKLLGVVEQELTYKTSFDPASYNRGEPTTAAVDENYHWGPNQVGQVWWNVDKVRYVDYEQSDLTYRIKNWGKLFAGSEIEVCEWVESSNLPSAYVTDGVALYPDDTAYVEQVTVDASGYIRTTYYFWVKNKETVSSIHNRRISISNISAILLSPTTQDIPYAALLRDNSVAVFNANKYISADDTILHIDYAILQNSNIIHNEYELVAESETSIIPEQIINKLIDSLTGADTYGHMVPDYKIGAAQRYGTHIRPRQSMFVNKLIATKNFVQYVNMIFSQFPICEDFDLSKLSLAEEIPFTWGDPTGKNIIVETLAERSYLNMDLLEPKQRILVKSDSDFFGQWAVYEVTPTKNYFLVRTQSYKTTDYWEKIDWFDASYNMSVKPTHTIVSEYDVAKLTLRKGETIWIRNNGSGQFVVYRVDGFSPTTGAKPDSRFFEVIKTYPSKDDLEHDVTPYGIAPGQFALVDTGEPESADDGKVYIREQTVDAENNATTKWTFIGKFPTSKGIRGATGVTTTRDDGNRFFEITKLYTSVISLNMDTRPEGISEGQFAIISTGDPENTDQDKIFIWTGKEYAYFTNLSGTMGLQVRQWQSVDIPNDNVILTLVGLENGTIRLKDSLWAHDTNQIGFSNDNFDTVKFDLNPTIEFRNIINAIKDDIFINVLEGKFNKVFFILLDYIMSEQRAVDWAFKTSFITVLHKLRKLGQFPNYIKDNQSFYESYINEVKPYRTKIREYLINYEGSDIGRIAATDFDIPAYYDADYNLWRSPNNEHARDELLLSANNQYANWFAHHSYSISHVLVSHKGRGYSATVPVELRVIGGGLPDKSPNHAKLEAVFDYYNGTLMKVNVLSEGSGYTSTPTIIIPSDGQDSQGRQTAVCYPVMKNKTVRSFDTAIKFDRISYSSTVKQWEKNTDYLFNDVVAFDNKAYLVPIALNSGNYFNPVEYSMMSDADLICANDRVSVFYSPNANMLPSDPAQLFDGVEYPGNKVDGSTFNNDPSTDKLADTLIYSKLNDMSLGLRPEDINIVGGKFIDTFESHAPEELLPGLVYDTLDIKVFTVPYNETTFQFDPLNNPVGYRISKRMSIEHNTTFDQGTTQFDTLPRWEMATNYVKDDVAFYNGRFYKAKYNLGANLPFNLEDWAATNEHRQTLFNFTAVNSPWEFRRICLHGSTMLVKDLRYDDTEIFVADVSKLPYPNTQLGNPGVVYLNGEKITYFAVDEVRNTLKQIRRGTWGTGVPEVHKAYEPEYNTDGTTVDSSADILQYQYASLVVDASSDQEIPWDLDTTTNRRTDESTSWLNPWPYNTNDGRVLMGDGLMFSATKQALFLKGCPTYLPWLPGELIDPLSFRSRYDEGPYADATYKGDPAQFDPRLSNPNHPVHPYDKDGYDSYRIDI